ncbi:MAG TPA: Rne/Rng family ribonuclease [Dongiaceae bacterium]|nr:Rne/Rng family ribonuclease [Dongiaceae bacterium]
MSKSMLVNVAAEEEYRVAVIDNGVLDLFEIETLSRENIKGNIYKAVVEGVNPGLEAAFVNYGGERAAFLPLDEINFKTYPSRNDGGGKGRGSRISRHLEKGMEILVQVIRDSYANKPPTLSTYYSLPGRYLVLMPGADAAGISRKIEDEEQRGRLRRILEGLTVPEGFGVIVRTAGMETSPRDLQADLDALLELWRNIQKAAQEARPQSLVYQERDLVIRTARDHFTSDMSEVLIDDEPTWKRLRRFFEAHMPEKAEVVKLYTGDKPIFSRHNVEDQIEQIYKRVVPLRSGGSVSVDQTEALTAIDVNSARSARGGSSEETATRTNLEAAEEIARQIRLRDIGGLIVIDFIDMESSRHIRQVERAFAGSMSRDKARWDVTRISKLGLMEVSRQRLKMTKSESSFSKCPICAGDGMVRTPESAARAAYRKIQARVARGGLAGATVYLPPDVALYLLNHKRDDLYRLESRSSLRLEVVPQPQMKVDQFEIEELRREEPEAVPMVTADAVDEAMVEGTLVPIHAPLAPVPLSPPGEGRGGDQRSSDPRGGDRDRTGRRRRRRRGGRGRDREGRPGEPRAEMRGTQGAAAPAPHAAETGSGDLPVFSEGPDGEDSPEPASMAAPAAGDGPRSAVEGDRPGRRRRRRRRGRGRNRGAEGGVNAPVNASQGRDAGSNGGPAPERAASEDRHEVPSRDDSYRTSHDAPASAASFSPPEAPGGGSAPGSSDAGGEKPRRRWWRRGVKG